jgi:hypothetical protein
MNATLGANVVQTARRDLHMPFCFAHLTLMMNNTGAAFTEKGLGVSMLSNGAMKLCDGNDSLDGFLLTPCANGATAYVITKSKVASFYVKGSRPGDTPTDGRFRMVNGVPTFTGVDSTNVKGMAQSTTGTAGVITRF